MEHDYNLLIENLKGRRYDEALREPILSDGFENSHLPDSVRYTLESMLEIDVSYAYKVYNNSRRIHEIINRELTKRGIPVDYRYQGALKTFTNILLYGDVEIIVLKKNPSDKPHLDVKELGDILLEILSGDHNFKSVDFSDKTRIRVTAQKPTCEIDILPSVWVSTPDYDKTKNEIYRGIVEYDFVNTKVKKYLPFLNIARFNARNEHTGGVLKSLSRLLGTLKKDLEEPIDLRDSEINSMMYAIPEEDLKVDQEHLLSLLPLVENHLNNLIVDDEFYKSLRSPSRMEKVFASQPEKKESLKKILESLRALIKDIKRDLAESGKALEEQIEYSKL
ncbi:MAG: hypothetical protein ABJP45_06475 [Cyclobacteriaceae bacterium]